MNSDDFNKSSHDVPTEDKPQVGEKKVYDHEVAWQVLIDAVLERLTESAKAKLPPQGIFGEFGYSLRFPREREIKGQLFVKPGANNKNERIVRASVHREGSYIMVNNLFFFTCTQEVFDWLKAEETVPLLVKTFRHLREKIE